MEEERWVKIEKLLKFAEHLYGNDPTMSNKFKGKTLWEVARENKAKIMKFLTEYGYNPGPSNFINFVLHDFNIANKILKIASLLTHTRANSEIERKKFYNIFFCVACNIPMKLKHFLKQGRAIQMPDRCWQILLHFVLRNQELKKKHSEPCGKLVVKYCLLQDELFSKPDFIENTIFSSYWDDCKVELLQMKNHMFGNVSVLSYVRKFNIDKLAALASNFCLGHSSAKFAYGITRRYEIYNDLIIEKVKEGMNRLYWVSLFEIVMSHSNLNKLNIYLIREVCKYLSNDDMKKVVLNSKTHLI